MQVLRHATWVANIVVISSNLRACVHITSISANTDVLTRSIHIAIASGPSKTTTSLSLSYAPDGELAIPEHVDPDAGYFAHRNTPVYNAFPPFHGSSRSSQLGTTGR